MYIDHNTIITAASVISAAVVILSAIFAVYRWCLLTYGILACLKGLKEQGCNGPVTEAIDKIEKHVNKQAHDQEG